MSEPVPLNYAPAKRNWRKRIVRILLAILLLTFTVASWQWGPYAWHQSQILYWQNQCMNFTLPADQVVYEEDPRLASSLLNTANYSPFELSPRYIGEELLVPGNQAPVITTAACFCPRCWHRLQAFIPYTVDPLAPGKPGPNLVIFLHELISSAGHRRLVCVSYAPNKESFTRVFIDGQNYSSCVLVPATWDNSCKPIRSLGAFSSMIGWPQVAPRCRIYAGQIDPNDPSHFTVRYKVWGQEDVLDGRLTDGDDVTLTARHVPKEP